MKLKDFGTYLEWGGGFFDGDDPIDMMRITSKLTIEDIEAFLTMAGGRSLSSSYYAIYGFHILIHGVRSNHLLTFSRDRGLSALAQDIFIELNNRALIKSDNK